MRHKDGDSVQDQIRKMTELFKELAVIGDPINEEESTSVVYLLATLRNSYLMLVIALEASVDFPWMEVVLSIL